VESLRASRKLPLTGERITIAAADPLNLTGIITPGDRVRAVTSSRVAYCDGVPLATMEGDYLRPLADFEMERRGDVAMALAGRRVPAVVSGFIGRR